MRLHWLNKRDVNLVSCDGFFIDTVNTFLFNEDGKTTVSPAIVLGYET